ncbi:stage III sporulation protein AF [Paenibacillus sp. H1-7]|uniref:stage III sporulation protein AF n=1 Tax=Paenibacillus sp. H1-7 TaxID=2282849 RepID=UPI001EF8847B|nr:stage III sporulation protein AF [Paenibacillus sp. H1-7]ULL15448.1 stage III sporulation protein AF [Paenibacillus sp. H1-7]
MEWLGNWLKSIVLVILLATFVDILLPSQTMQRYVKTVLSLFILLTLLSPLLSIFQKQISLEQLLSNAMFTKSGALFASSSKQGEAEQMQSLGSIQQQAEQLKTAQEQQSQRMMQQQIEGLMKKGIEQAGPGSVKVQSVKVETGKDSKGQVQIVQVHVQVAPGSTESKGESNSGREPMKPVYIEPVTIGIGQQSKPAAQETPDNGGQAGGYEQERTQIRMSLSKEWQIPMDRIAVDVAGDKTKS